MVRGGGGGKQKPVRNNYNMVPLRNSHPRKLTSIFFVLSWLCSCDCSFRSLASQRPTYGQRSYVALSLQRSWGRVGGGSINKIFDFRNTRCTWAGRTLDLEGRDDGQKTFLNFNSYVQNLHFFVFQRDRQTDRQMDRQTDREINLGWAL